IGDLTKGQALLAGFEENLKEKTAERDAAIAKAESQAKDAEKKEAEIKKSKDAAAKEFKTKVETLENYVAELQVYAALAQRQPNQARAKKLLSEFDHIAEYRHALLWLRAGDQEKALKVAKDAVESGEGEVLPLAAQVEILMAANDDEKARQVFETLSKIGHRADLDTPPLARVTQIAERLGLAGDWRTRPEPAKDLGEKPDLDSLGPFRWTPPKAKPFTLPGLDDRSISLSDYRGRSVLVMFFLGKDCAHCMEQLDAFSPLTGKFEAAGIEILAVSTDTAAGLSQTLRTSDEGTSPFPFPLVSDHSLDHFRAYRAYDDFEAMPLHGTFLIDGRGRIRWQDISYEPFMRADWLLEECQRLLAIEDGT
ncbi:MAG: redoxin domain-containing protein, partial [Verrucomicrobiota bacterium]